MAITIKDIAREANVAPSTVSRALQNHPRISLETRQQIQSLADDMGYIPSEVARSLVGMRTTTLGVAIPDFADPFYMGILSGIEEAAIAHGFDLVVGSFKRDAQRKRKLFDAFEEKRLAGLVIAGTLVDDAYLTRVRRALPAVLLNKPDFTPAVDIDQELGAELAVDHLVSLGHRRIAFIGLGTDSESQRRRFKGYRRALGVHGLQPDPDLQEEGDGRIEGGAHAAAGLLTGPSPPSALFCYNDRTAIGAIHAIHQRGLRVPDDLSVVGIDDLEFSAYVAPALTTIRQPNVELGRRAASMLLAGLQGEPMTAQTLKPQLIIRESTGPAPALPGS